jgi:hypothetical protein
MSRWFDASIPDARYSTSTIAFHNQRRSIDEGIAIANLRSAIRRLASMNKDILGRYRLLERIGAGGMGEVWKAHDGRLDRIVAVKMLLRGALGSLNDDAGRERFRREAHTLSQLSHAGIATVFDFDADSDNEFLVMEFVPGGTLESRLRESPRPLVEIQSLGAAIADALEYAHRHSVLHRDLKAENVALTTEGQPKILDFGLALRRVLLRAPVREGDVVLPHDDRARPSFCQRAYGPRASLGSAGPLRRSARRLRDWTTAGGRDCRPVIRACASRAAAGNVAEARRMLDELRAAREQRVVSAWGIGALHASLGDIDEAYRWLEIAVQEKASGLSLLRVHPRLDPIRSDARYWPLVGRVGLDDGAPPDR